MARRIKSDKNFIASGVGEKTSKKVSTIFTKDGGSFRRKNANQYGKADGGNDYTETRPNRTDKYETGGDLTGSPEVFPDTDTLSYAKGSNVKGGEYKFGYDITLKKHTSKNGTDIELRQNPKTKYYTIFVNGFGGTSTPTEFLHVAEDDYKYELSKYESLEKRGVFAKGSTIKGRGKKKKTKKPKEPMVVRGYFEDVPYEYENGGNTNAFNYTIGGL